MAQKLELRYQGQSCGVTGKATTSKTSIPYVAVSSRPAIPFPMKLPVQKMKDDSPDNMKMEAKGETCVKQE